MPTQPPLLKGVRSLFAYLHAAQTAAFALDRRLAIQTTLVRGQNLQMMDFAELGRPGLRAHLAHPVVARMMPNTRAVVRVLKVGRWVATVVVYAQAIFVGMMGAAVATHFTPT